MWCYGGGWEVSSQNALQLILEKWCKNHNIKHGHITKKKSKASMWVQVFIYPSLYPNTTQFFVRAVKHIHLMLYLQIKLYRDSSEFEFINDLVCLTYYSTKLTLVLTEWISDIWSVNQKPCVGQAVIWTCKVFYRRQQKAMRFLKRFFSPQASTTENKNLQL